MFNWTNYRRLLIKIRYEIGNLIIKIQKDDYEYFKLLFTSAIVCLPGGFILRILVKKNLIVKDNPVGKENLISFGTKLMLFSLIILVVGGIFILIKK